MKKITAIFLLLFFCLFQSGHILTYFVQLWQLHNAVRNEILAGVPDRYLISVVENSQVHWEEENREFTLAGEYYDVVRIKNVDGQRILYCLNDNKEEQLVKDFSKLVKTGTAADRSRTSKRAFNFQLLDEIKDQFTSVSRFAIGIKNNYRYLSPGLASISRKIIIPPPR